MSAENEQKQPGSVGQLVAMLKQVISTDEPTEADFAELGESLLAVVKGALSGHKRPVDSAR